MKKEIVNVVAVIPTLNEEKNIFSVLKNTQNYVNKIIVVDSSTDRTSKIVKKYFQKIFLLREEKKGKGLAVRKGLEMVMKFNPKYVIFLDADGEKNPKDIPKLLRALEKYDMVIGRRNKMRSIHRILLNKFTNFWVNVLTNSKLSDSCSGFVGIKTELIKKMRLVSKGFEIEIELVLESFRNRGKIGEVSVGVPRISISKLNIRHMIEINKFFDTWTIAYIKKSEINFLKKLFLLFSCYIGLLISSVILKSWNVKDV